jgi:hypothetical protein
MYKIMYNEIGRSQPLAGFSNVRQFGNRNRLSSQVAALMFAQHSFEI